jgi:hypothetical protein
LFEPPRKRFNDFRDRVKYQQWEIKSIHPAWKCQEAPTVKSRLAFIHIPNLDVSDSRVQLLLGHNIDSNGDIITRMLNKVDVTKLPPQKRQELLSNRRTAIPANRLTKVIYNQRFRRHLEDIEGEGGLWR